MISRCHRAGLDVEGHGAEDEQGVGAFGFHQHSHYRSALLEFSVDYQPVEPCGSVGAWTMEPHHYR